MATAYLRSLQSRIGTVTKGFYYLYKEFLVVRPLYSISPNLRTRAQQELIRINQAALKKVGVLFVCQLIPIVGNIPVLVAIAYPKQLLTHHFWSSEQRQAYLEEDFSLRKSSARQLINLVLENDKHSNSNQTKGPVVSSSPINLDGFISTLDEPTFQLWMTMIETRKIALNADRKYLTLLSINNNISEYPILYRTCPLSILKHLLSQRVKEIVEDDVKLHREGINTLNVQELRDACLRRGFQPIKDEPLLRNNIDLWLGKQVQHHDRQLLSECLRVGQSDNKPPVALLHLIAHNAALG